MGWKYFDYRCTGCTQDFESCQWVPTIPDDDFVEEEVHCEDCGEGAELMPTANLGWANDKEKQTEMLKKRSREHTAKEQKSGNMMSPKDLPKL